MVEYRNNFLWLMNKLKPYIVEFEEDDTMKPKKYLSEITLRSEKR